MALPRLFKETNIFKKGAIAEGMEEAGSKAENYIQDNSNGIFIHKLSDLLNGVRITDIIEIIRNNVSVAMFGTSVRIGQQADANIQISSDQTNGSVMTFNDGSSYVPVKIVGKSYVGYIKVDNDQMGITGSHQSTLQSVNIDRLAVNAYGVNNQRHAAVIMDAYGIDGRAYVQASDVDGIHLNASNVWVEGTLKEDGGLTYVPQKSSTTWIQPTVTSSAINTITGGYYIEGKRCYVQMRCKLAAQLSADSVRQICSEMPLPRTVDEVALNILVRSRAGHTCRVYPASAGDTTAVMQIIADPDHAISANQNVTITGVYTIA